MIFHIISIVFYDLRTSGTVLPKRPTQLLLLLGKLLVETTTTQLHLEHNMNNH